VVDVIKSSCSGIVSSAACSIAEGEGGRRVAGLVRGNSVMVVGRCPPKEKVERERRRWPCNDLGSVVH